MFEPAQRSMAHSDTHLIGNTLARLEVIVLVDWPNSDTHGSGRRAEKRNERFAWKTDTP